MITRRQLRIGHTGQEGSVFEHILEKEDA